ncbi:hypothetical protein R3P38DRAFT_2815780 [Favolaschia claudopus]|uniref:Uncharacterized protein n=1 Tax=Favolaschia claudopus TaxID=2862362 RepID=A0AAV9Z0U5_9AGAR
MRHKLKIYEYESKEREEAICAYIPVRTTACAWHAFPASGSLVSSVAGVEGKTSTHIISQVSSTSLRPTPVSIHPDAITFPNSSPPPTPSPSTASLTYANKRAMRAHSRRLYISSISSLRALTYHTIPRPTRHAGRARISWIPYTTMSVSSEGYTEDGMCKQQEEGGRKRGGRAMVKSASENEKQKQNSCEETYPGVCGTTSSSITAFFCLTPPPLSPRQPPTRQLVPPSPRPRPLPPPPPSPTPLPPPALSDFDATPAYSTPAHNSIANPRRSGGGRRCGVILKQGMLRRLEYGIGVGEVMEGGAEGGRGWAGAAYAGGDEVDLDEIERDEDSRRHNLNAARRIYCRHFRIQPIHPHGFLLQRRNAYAEPSGRERGSADAAPRRPQSTAELPQPHNDTTIMSSSSSTSSPCPSHPLSSPLLLIHVLLALGTAISSTTVDRRRRCPPNAPNAYALPPTYPHTLQRVRRRRSEAEMRAGRGAARKSIERGGVERRAGADDEGAASSPTGEDIYGALVDVKDSHAEEPCHGITGEAASSTPPRPTTWLGGDGGIWGKRDAQRIGDSQLRGAKRKPELGFGSEHFFKIRPAVFLAFATAAAQADSRRFRSPPAAPAKGYTFGGYKYCLIRFRWSRKERKRFITKSKLLQGLVSQFSPKDPQLDVEDGECRFPESSYGGTSFRRAKVCVEEKDNAVLTLVVAVVGVLRPILLFHLNHHDRDVDSAPLALQLEYDGVDSSL